MTELVMVEVQDLDAWCEDLKRREGSLQWEWGDLALAVGARGRDLREFAEAHEIDYNTLRDYRHVAVSYRLDDRSASLQLTWTHFQSIAAREDRLEWLRRAGEEGWSRRTMLAEIEANDLREIRQEQEASMTQVASMEEVPLRMPEGLSEREQRRWRALDEARQSNPLAEELMRKYLRQEIGLAKAEGIIYPERADPRKSHDGNQREKAKIDYGVGHSASRAQKAKRDAEIIRLRGEGYRASQIAEAVNLSPGAVYQFFKTHDMKPVPRTYERRIDPNVTMGKIIQSVYIDSEDIALGHIYRGWDRLDREQFADWIVSLGKTISTLSRLQRSLRKDRSNDNDGTGETDE